MQRDFMIYDLLVLKFKSMIDILCGVFHGRVNYLQWAVALLLRKYCY